MNATLCDVLKTLQKVHYEILENLCVVERRILTKDGWIVPLARFFDYRLKLSKVLKPFSRLYRSYF